jgi:hypothetical protein
MTKFSLLTLSLFLLGSYYGFAQENEILTASVNTEINNSGQYYDKEDQDGEAPWFVRKYEAQFGIFMPFSNTDMRVGNDKGNLGTDVDLENDLGLKTYTFSAYTAFSWHISRRSKLSLSYFYIGRSATHTLERDIEFKDTTFHAFATVNTLFNTHIGRIAYSYAILSKPNYEAGFIIGSHIVNCNTKVELNSSIGNLNYEDDLAFTAPLPDIGVFGGWAINDKMSINGDISYLPVSISDVTVNILSYNLAFQYQPIQNFGLSLSYTGLDFKVSIDGDPLNGYLKWGYHGPALTATYRFGRGF